VRGQVLVADAAQRVTADMLLAVGTQRATRPRWSVQLGGVGAVVDDEGEAAGERGGHLVEPVEHGQVDLGSLAVGQLHTGAGEPFGQARRGRLTAQLDEAIFLPADVELLQPALVVDDAMHG
jgi:hypothetical protein